MKKKAIHLIIYLMMLVTLFYNINSSLRFTMMIIGFIVLFLISNRKEIKKLYPTNITKILIFSIPISMILFSILWRFNLQYVINNFILDFISIVLFGLSTLIITTDITYSILQSKNRLNETEHNIKYSIYLFSLILFTIVFDSFL